MRIRGHVDYGNGAGPRALSGAPVRQFVSTKAPRKPKTPDRPKLSDDEIVAYLRGFCDRGERAPMNKQIRVEVGDDVNLRLMGLALKGRIVIEYFGSGFRVIRVGRAQTAPPPFRSWALLRRISKRGDFMMTAQGQWVETPIKRRQPRPGRALAG